MDTAPIVLAYLLPIGILLVAWGGWEDDRARSNATTGLMVIALAALAYAALGLAFQFGGIGLKPDSPIGLRGLDRMWTPLSNSTGGWGVIGLEGFLLSAQSTTPGDTALLFNLFLHQLPLVMAAALIPGLALAGRARVITISIVTILTAGLIVPLIGAWTWGGGWLSTLGSDANFGHGFIDPGSAATAFMTAGLITLAALIALKIRRPAAHEPAQLPPIYLPLRSISGAILIGLGWLAWLATDPMLQATKSIDLSFTLTNILLGAAAATLLALMYGWFTTGKPDVQLTARGAVAGWIALTAAAPFVPTWAAIVIGAIAGLWTPIGMYIVERSLQLDDATGSIATAGLAGLWSLIAVALLADGTYGAGWNNVGVKEYLGVAGQGVTGLLAQTNLQNDPGQLSAQVTGVLTIALLVLLISWLLLRPLRRFSRVSEAADKAIVAAEAAAPTVDKLIS